METLLYYKDGKYKGDCLLQVKSLKISVFNL